MSRQGGRRKRSRHRARRSWSTIGGWLARYFIIDTLESVLEWLEIVFKWTVPFGNEIASNIRDEDQSALDSGFDIARNLFRHHCDTLSGVYALTLYLQVTLSQFNLAVALVSAHNPHIDESQPLVVIAAVLGVFVCGYVSSVLASVAVTAEKTKASTVFAAAFTFLAAVRSPNMFHQVLYYQMFAGLLLGLLMGAPTVRTLKRLTRR